MAPPFGKISMSLATFTQYIKGRPIPEGFVLPDHHVTVNELALMSAADYAAVLARTSGLAAWPPERRQALDAYQAIVERANYIIAQAEDIHECLEEEAAYAPMLEGPNLWLKAAVVSLHYLPTTVSWESFLRGTLLVHAEVVRPPYNWPYTHEPMGTIVEVPDLSRYPLVELGAEWPDWRGRSGFTHTNSKEMEVRYRQNLSLSSWQRPSVDVASPGVQTSPSPPARGPSVAAAASPSLQGSPPAPVDLRLLLQTVRRLTLGRGDEDTAVAGAEIVYNESSRKFDRLQAQLRGKVRAGDITMWANRDNPLEEMEALPGLQEWPAHFLLLLVHEYTTKVGRQEEILLESDRLVAQARQVEARQAVNTSLPSFAEAPKVKIPDPPHFDGKEPTPVSVKTWLRQIDLVVKQLRPADTVLYAMNFLKDNAAVWRDTTLSAKFPGLMGVPWIVFEEELLTRFVPPSAQLQALTAFQSLRMHSSVDDYNGDFLMALDGLQGLSHVDLPDSTAQIKQYLNGLTQAMRIMLRNRATEKDASCLRTLMSMAADCDHLRRRMSLSDIDMFEDSKRHVPAPMQERDNKRARTGPSPGRNGGRGGGNNGNGRHGGGYGGYGGSYGGHRDGYGGGRQRGGGHSGGGFRKGNGHSRDQDQGNASGARSWPANATVNTESAHLQPQARYSAMRGRDGRSYPNLAWKRLYFSYNQTSGNCTYCGNKYDHESPNKHSHHQCASPLNSKPPSFQVGSASIDGAAWAAFDAAVCQSRPCENAAVNACVSSVPDVQRPAAYASESREALCATLTARPFTNNTLVFLGAVGAQPLSTPTDVGADETARILVDTGSSHCCVDRAKAVDMPRTGRMFSVNLAKQGTFVTDIPEVLMYVRLGDYEAELPALVLPLPAKLDVILGGDWQIANDVTIQPRQGQMSFVASNTGLPHILRTPDALEHDSFNSQFLFASAATCGRSIDTVLMIVRAVDQTDSHANVYAATAEESSSKSVSHADEIKVEHDEISGAMKSLVQKYAHVFELPVGLPPDRNISHAIPLESGARPINQRTRRLSYKQEEEMVQQIRDLLSKGWIQPSTSPWGSPILFVKKKDGSMRMCVDYRAVNKLTVKNSYPLPRIDDMLDRLSGAKFFTCLDLQQAYHQVRLTEEDVPKTAFTTPMGLFEYKVLPFGLCNAPSTFQALMNTVLGADLRHCCLVYLDDIIIFSKTPAQHLQHVEAVLSRLAEKQLFAKLSKCEFGLSKVKFLGHVVSGEGIQPDGDKVKLVKGWPVPTSVKDLRQFVGLAQYFRKFVQGFSTMIAPLTRLFKKDAVFSWSKQCQEAFDQIKEALTSPPCLKLPDDSTPFTVICDACKYGIGAVLLQEDRPVAFEGRRMTETELKWGATEKEMLAVVYHLEKWRCYLEGRHFTAVTDHQPNTWFASQKELNPRLVRWYERIRSYDFTWQYKPGRVNVADPLSRHPAFLNVLMAVVTRSQRPNALTGAQLEPTRHAQRPLTSRPSRPGSTVPHMPGIVADAADPSPAVPLPQIDDEAGQPPVLVPNEVQDPLPSAFEQGLQSAVDGDCIGNTPFNTSAAEVMRQIQQGYSQDAYFAPSNAAEWGRSGICRGEDSDLFFKGNAVVVPDVHDLRRAIIRELHCSPYVGHFGAHRSQQLIARYFFWPKMDAQIVEYVKGCELCQRNKGATGKKAGLLIPLPVPEHIWEDISMDFVGPLPKTERGFDTILNVVDRLSKMAHFLPCKSDITATEVAELFAERIWSLHGLPRSIVTDRGVQFVNEWNTALMRLIGTKHCVTSAYHPESDGQTERTNRVLCEMLRHYVNARHDNWDKLLPIVEFAHNNAYSTATGSTPFFICYGKHPRTPMQEVIDLARQQWKDNPAACSTHFRSVDQFVADRQNIVRHARASMESARQRMMAYENKKRKPLTFEVGDQVSLKTSHLGISTLPSKKLFCKYMGPFTVSKIINDNAYMLELPRTWRAHNVFNVSLLKPFISNGEAVDPMSFTIKGGKSQELEVEDIFDYEPKTRTQRGALRKVRDLTFHVKWRGVRKGIDAEQPYDNVRGTSEDALAGLARRHGLPADIFSKPGNSVPAIA